MMNIQRSIISSIISILFLIIALCSCKKQNEVVCTLPMEKLYILEYRYTLPEEDEESLKFYTVGFCELDNDFNVKYARRIFYKSNYFYNSTEVIPDSLRSKISEILLKYQADTTFLYQGGDGDRIYDGSKRSKKNDFVGKYSILQELSLFRVTHWRSQEKVDKLLEILHKLDMETEAQGLHAYVLNVEQMI